MDKNRKSKSQTSQAENPQVTATPKEAPETPERLKAMIAAYDRALKSATARKERIDGLMKRKSANGWVNSRRGSRPGWNPSKKAQMVRRYMSADATITEATATLEQLRHRLEQIAV